MQANIKNDKYQIIIYWSEIDQAFIADVPEIAGCKADGTNYQEAVSNVEVKIGDRIERALIKGQTIPIPNGKLQFV